MGHKKGTRMETKNAVVRKTDHDFADGPIWDERLKRWRVQFSWKDQNGNRKQLKKRFRHKRDADRWFDTTQKEIILGVYDQLQRSKSLTLGKALDLYRESVRTNKSFESTQSNLKIWEREFGRDTRLSEVTKARIIAARTKRIDSGIARSTADTNLITLKCAFNWLECERHWLNNPAKGIKLFRVDNRRLVYLQLEQFSRLLAACENGPWYMRPIIIVAALTGLRKANNIGLEWSEVDFRAGYIQISGTKTKNHRKLIIPMCDIVYATLYDLYQTRHERDASRYVFVDQDLPTRDGRRRFSREFKIEAVRRVQAGEKMARVARELGIFLESLWRWEKRVREKGEDHLHQLGWPPKRREGKPTSATNTDPMNAESVGSTVVEFAWKRALTDSGIEKDFGESFHFHDLRHTCASWHVMLGTSPFRLKDLLGHNDLKSTERYAHVPLNERKADKAMIEALFSVSTHDNPADRAEFGRRKLDDLFPQIFPIGATTTDKPAAVTASRGERAVQPSLFEAVG